MGVGQSKPEEIKEIEEDLGDGPVKLMENILDKCRIIAKKYKEDFLNKNFCDRLAFVLESSLQEFDMDILEGVKSNLEKKNVPKRVKVMLSYDVHKDDKFVVETLSEELKDYLDNENKIKFTKDYVKNLSEDQKLNFISKQIMNELMGTNNNQKGGAINQQKFNFSVPNVTLNENINVNKNKNKKNNNNVNTNLEVSNQQTQNRNQNENSNKISKLKGELANISSISSLNNTNLVNDEDEDLFVNEETKSKNNNKKNRRRNIPEKKLNKKEENVVKQVEELNNEAVESAEDDIDLEEEEKNAEKNKKSVNVTKEKLCKKIAEHYVVRMNIIAAILSALPYKSKKGDLEGFCYSRYKNLEEGKVCIPSGGLDELNSLSKEELLEIVKEYINVTDESECKSKGGYFKILTDMEKNSLENSNYIYNQIYRENYKNLKNSYLNDLKLLMDILNELQNNTKLNNSAVTLLSKKTRDILTGLYNNCQTYYINAYICLIKAKLNKDRDDAINTTLVDMLR